MKPLLAISVVLILMTLAGCDFEFYHNRNEGIRVSATYFFENRPNKFSAFTMHKTHNEAVTFATVLVFEKEFFDSTTPQISSWGDDKAYFLIDEKCFEIENGDICFYDSKKEEIVIINIDALAAGKINIMNDRFSEDFDNFIKKRAQNKESPEQALSLRSTVAPRQRGI